MKYKYKVKSDKERGHVWIELEEPKVALATAILGEINHEDLKRWYAEGIDMVLNSKSEYEERDGEGYGLRIRKDYTEVYFIYDENQKCKIETSELRELIEIYWEAFLEFHKDKLDMITNKYSNKYNA
jgi:hypothetical protein